MSQDFLFIYTEYNISLNRQQVPPVVILCAITMNVFSLHNQKFNNSILMTLRRSLGAASSVLTVNVHQVPVAT